MRYRLMYVLVARWRCKDASRRRDREPALPHHSSSTRSSLALKLFQRSALVGGSHPSLSARQLTLAHRVHFRERRVSEMEKDVVCGMDVDPSRAPASSQYKGKTYYFCCNQCKTAFDANPEQFATLT